MSTMEYDERCPNPACDYRVENRALHSQLATSIKKEDEIRTLCEPHSNRRDLVVKMVHEVTKQLTAAQQRVKELEALVGTVRDLLQIKPVRNVADISPEEHSKEIVGQLQAKLAAVEAERDGLAQGMDQAIAQCKAQQQRITALEEQLRAMTKNFVEGT